jgi:hypothetical protein
VQKILNSVIVLVYIQKYYVIKVKKFPIKYYQCIIHTASVFFLISTTVLYPTFYKYIHVYQRFLCFYSEKSLEYKKQCQAPIKDWHEYLILLKTAFEILLPSLVLKT